MPTLQSLAGLIRSKNAGPFVLTFDIMFLDEKNYSRVRDSGVLTRELFSRIYGCAPEKVRTRARSNSAFRAPPFRANRATAICTGGNNSRRCWI